MNKKYLMRGGAVLAAMLILMVIFLRDGRGPNESENLDIKDLSGNISDVEIQKIVENIAKADADFNDPEMSSNEKIEEAFFSEKINAEEYALLSVRSIFGDASSLPEDYRGAENTSKDNAFLFGLIHSKWNTFSEETKVKLLPFVVSSTDLRSYFNPNNTDNKRKNILQEVSVIPTAKAEETMDFMIIEALPNVKINYMGEEQKKAAEWIAEAIRDAHPRYKPFFGMEYKPTNITIVSSRDLNADGQAKMSEAEDALPGQCDILVLAPQDEKGIKTTTVHEWFHCYQFWMNLVYEKSDTMWLMEATATWSEDYVYHSFASEHKYDPWFFAKTDYDLLSIKGDHEYALYLWFYYLVQQSQGDPSHVYRALKLGIDNDIRGKMMALVDFAHIHRDFALWNWNQRPFSRYVDEPFFPNVIPFYKSVKREVISSNKEYLYPIALSKGAMTYNMIFFPNENVKNIEFSPRKFTGSEEKSSRGLQALYRINGEWLYEDWTGLEKRTFCRNLPEENIEMVVLIANNAELLSDAEGVVPIKTEKKCNPGWHGSLSVKWEKQNQMTAGWTHGEYTESGEYHLSEILEYEPEYDNLLVAEQQYFAKFESSQKVESPSKDCGQIWKRDTKRFGGSGFINYKKDAESMPERANGNGNEDVNTLGGEYELAFEMFGAPKEYGNKFSGIDVSSTLNKSCSYGMMPEADGLNIENYKTGRNDFTYEPPWGKITIPANAKHFSGQDTFKYSDKVTGTIKWNYVRVD